jgi:hypothetical protein
MTRKLTENQIKNAVEVMIRFLEEYQTVDRHDADAIVEYEEKMVLFAPLSVKKLARSSSYSFVDLLPS